MHQGVLTETGAPGLALFETWDSRSTNPDYEGASQLDIKSNEGETQAVRCEPKRPALGEFYAGHVAAFVIWQRLAGLLTARKR